MGPPGKYGREQGIALTVHIALTIGSTCAHRSLIGKILRCLPGRLADLAPARSASRMATGETFTRSSFWPQSDGFLAKSYFSRSIHRDDRLNHREPTEISTPRRFKPSRSRTGGTARDQRCGVEPTRVPASGRVRICFRMRSRTSRWAPPESNGHGCDLDGDRRRGRGRSVPRTAGDGG